VIQECVDEVTEEQVMLQQQELAGWHKGGSRKVSL
jgi:hypothetical protein